MPEARFVVDVSDMERLANYMDAAGEDILERFQDELADLAHIVMLEVFEKSWSGLDEDQFPQIYRDHVREILGEIPIDFIGGGSSAGIAIDFDELGTKEELESAYHRHAQLAGGGTVEGPYDGQELKNTSAHRHIFFEALIRGTDYIDPNTGKKIPARKLAGLWDQTLEEYVEIWGNKAPEWLFLQHGTKWQPNIPPYDIAGEINREIAIRGSRIWEAEWKRVLSSKLLSDSDLSADIRNLYTSSNVFVDPTGGYHSPSGGIVVDGKTYKGGQFLPKKR